MYDNNSFTPDNDTDSCPESVRSAADPAADEQQSEPCAQAQPEDSGSYRYSRESSGDPGFYREDIYAPLQEPSARGNSANSDYRSYNSTCTNGGSAYYGGSFASANTAGGSYTAPGNDSRYEAPHDPQQRKDEQKQAAKAEKKARRRAARESRRTRNAKLRRTTITAAAMLAIGCLGAFLGIVLGSSVIADRAVAKISADAEGAGTTVIYRAVSSTADTTADPSAINVAAVAAAVQDSVVEISTEVVSYYSDWFGRVGQNISEGAGSGVIISADGYIVTCHHVVENATSITIALHDGNTYPAVLVGSDEQNDLAVLKIEASDLTPAILGNSSELVVGSGIVVVGNPLGSLGGTVTSGYISALERELTIEDETYTLLQTDAAINGGNSGGGMFNANGELVGVVNAKAESIGVEGLGFALPIDDLKDSIENIISYGYAGNNITLGIVSVTINDDRTAAGYNVRDYGVYIVYVVEGSNAELAGLQVGDRIVSMDGEKISDDDQLAGILSDKKVGDKLTVVVIRDNREMSVDVVLYDALGEKKAS